MHATISTILVTSEKTIYEGSAVAVRIPASDGYMEFRFQHAPLITCLGIGTLTVKEPDGKELCFFIGGGYAEIHENNLIVLADVAENSNDIDLNRANEAKSRATKRILDPAGSKWDIYRANTALSRAENRIKTVHQTGKGSTF